MVVGAAGGGFAADVGATGAGVAHPPTGVSLNLGKHLLYLV